VATPAAILFSMDNIIGRVPFDASLPQAFHTSEPEPLQLAEGV